MKRGGTDRSSPLFAGAAAPLIPNGRTPCFPHLLLLTSFDQHPSLADAPAV
jgi:hypothetical protein